MYDAFQPAFVTHLSSVIVYTCVHQILAAFREPACARYGEKIPGVKASSYQGHLFSMNTRISPYTGAPIVGRNCPTMLATIQMITAITRDLIQPILYSNCSATSQKIPAIKAESSPVPRK
jgi:hypothetical protein